MKCKACLCLLKELSRASRCFNPNSFQVVQTAEAEHGNTHGSCLFAGLEEAHFERVNCYLAESEVFPVTKVLAPALLELSVWCATLRYNCNSAMHKPLASLP